MDTLQPLLRAIRRLTLPATALAALGTIGSVPRMSCQVSAGEPNQLRQERQQPRSAAASALFRRQCVKCHGTDGRGTAARGQFPAIPDFTRRSWQEKREDAALVQSILDGKASAMPPFGEKLSKEQARELVAYVRTFARKQATGEKASKRDFDKRFRQLEEELARLQRQSDKASETAPRPAPRQAARAAKADPATDGSATRRLFRQHCQKCHGADGTGSSARARLPNIPDFTDARWQRRRTDAQLLASLLEGKGTKMPAFGEKINEAQARELIAQVRALGGKRQGPGTAPARAPEESRRQGPSREPAEDEEEEPLPEQSRFGRLIGWLGRFHPAMVHFPIGLLVAAALAEGLFIVTGSTLFDSAGRVCVWFGAVGAFPAATLGWFLGGTRLTDPDWILTSHRWLGTSTAACALVVLTLSEVSRRPGRPARGAFRLVLLLIAALVLATGFFGGALMHGLDYYAWPPQAAAHLLLRLDVSTLPLRAACLS